MPEEVLTVHSLTDCARQSVQLRALSAARIAEALELFKISGWEDRSLQFVRSEMAAFLRGDVDGYIRSRFIMAVAEEQVIGVAAWAPSMCAFAVYELSWATVLPAWRHRGINRLMLDERINQIRTYHGPEPFTVIVYTWDNSMYAQMGFTPGKVPAIRSAADKGKQLLVAQFTPPERADEPV